ncbi:MAG: TonB-dependent receptor [Gemmatimonadales bacterium]
MPSNLSALVVAVYITSGLVPATTSGQAPDTATLSTVVISATKTPVSRASLTQAVTVISGDDLRNRGITRVSDALREVPGVALVQNGSVGSVSTLFLRGGESRYTKVLIDGVAVNAPGGFFDFSHLTTDNIERIEIVRGPSSVLYGADAVSGIVQIFTRQGRGPISISADARAGNYGSREATLEVSGAAGPARYSVGGGARRADGSLPFNNQYYNGTLSASAGFNPAPGSDALVSARYTNAEFHYPTDFTGAPVDSNAYRVQHRLTVGVDTKSRISNSLTGRLLLGTNEVSDLTEDIAVPFGSSTPRHSAFMSRNKRRAAEAGIALRLIDSATVNLGFEYSRESEASSNGEGAVGGPTTATSSFSARRDNKAVYSELILPAATGAYWILSARRDDNSDYDPVMTYRVGATVPAGESVRLRGSFSTAFNAPAFNQLRPTLYTIGSPNLDPEHTRSWELGIDQTLMNGRIRASVSYFRQRFSDLIQYVPGGPPNFLGSYANLTEAKSNGYETSLMFAPAGQWSARASFTEVKPRVTKVSTAYTGDLKVGDALIRRPTRSGNATLTWSPSTTGSLSVTGNYVGSRPDLDFSLFPSPTVTLPAYTKIDVSGYYNLYRSESGRSAVALTFRVENALDRKYEEVLNFPAPRRTYLAGARITGGL